MPCKRSVVSFEDGEKVGSKIKYGLQGICQAKELDHVTARKQGLSLTNQFLITVRDLSVVNTIKGYEAGKNISA